MATNLRPDAPEGRARPPGLIPTLVHIDASKQSKPHNCLMLSSSLHTNINTENVHLWPTNVWWVSDVLLEWQLKMKNQRLEFKQKERRLEDQCMYFCELG